MQDRVSLNPGRVLVTPEDGSAAFYATMTRADNPTQEGTALSASTLLKDTTAELFGLSEEKTPDAAFQLLAKSYRYKLISKAVATKNQSVSINFDASAVGKALKLILIPETEDSYQFNILAGRDIKTSTFQPGGVGTVSGSMGGNSQGRVSVINIYTDFSSNKAKLDNLVITSTTNSGLLCIGSYYDSDNQSAPYIMASVGNAINTVHVFLVEDCFDNLFNL